MDDQTQAPAASPALGLPSRQPGDKTAAACLVRRQRRLPLSRPGLRRAAVPACRRARHGMAAHRHRRADLRAADPAWRSFARADRSTRLLLLAFGACLAVMNCSFYLALDRLPISLVAAIEFVGTIGVALIGLRSAAQPRRPCRRRHRHLAAHRRQMVRAIRSACSGPSSTARCSSATSCSATASPAPAPATALRASVPPWRSPSSSCCRSASATRCRPFSHRRCCVAAIGVGICSSVIPYICDQLAMSRLPRSSFALMLSLLPVTATLIGVIVLRQIPSLGDCLGIALVVAGVAFHRPASTSSHAQENILSSIVCTSARVGSQSRLTATRRPRIEPIPHLSR